MICLLIKVNSSAHLFLLVITKDLMDIQQYFNAAFHPIHPKPKPISATGGIHPES